MKTDFNPKSLNLIHINYNMFKTNFHNLDIDIIDNNVVIIIPGGS